MCITKYYTILYSIYFRKQLLYLHEVMVKSAYAKGFQRIFIVFNVFLIFHYLFVFQTITSSLVFLLWRRGWHKVGSAWPKFSTEFSLKNHQLLHNEDKLQKKTTLCIQLSIITWKFPSRQELKPT